MTYTKSTPVGGIKADLAAVPVDATTGCEPADYASGHLHRQDRADQARRLHLRARSRRPRPTRARSARSSTTTPTGALSGTLGDPATGKIPTGGITQAEGEKLAADLAKGPVNISFEIRQLQQKRSTNNVIAETRGGNAANTVMLGSHLDSVTAGPGINDNGSGSAGLLEVAQELAKSKSKPANKVRFAWWSAEENGLLGSEAYVAQPELRWARRRSSST